MKLFKAKLIVSALAIGLMSGCASNAPKITEESIAYDKTISYGKNLLSAGGAPIGTLHKMKDVEISQSDYNKLLSESSAIHSGAAAGALSATALALDMYNAVGFVDTKSILGSADFKSMLGLGLLKGFLAPKHPSLVDHMVMWVPKEYGKTEEEAVAKVNEVFLNAYKASVPEGHTLIKNPKNKVYENAATGGICDKSTSERNSTCQGSIKDPIYTSSGALSYFAKDLSVVQPGFRPAFIDNPGQDAWVIYVKHGTNRGRVHCYLYDRDEQPQSDLDACTDFNKQYSENIKGNLPNWVYLYSFDKEKGLGIVEQMGEVRNTFPLLISKQ